MLALLAARTVSLPRPAPSRQAVFPGARRPPGAGPAARKDLQPPCQSAPPGLQVYPQQHAGLVRIAQHFLVQRATPPPRDPARLMR